MDSNSDRDTPPGPHSALARQLLTRISSEEPLGAVVSDLVDRIDEIGNADLNLILEAVGARSQRDFATRPDSADLSPRSDSSNAA
jgi:hypothetical protein